MSWQWLAWLFAAWISASAVSWARPVTSWVRWLPPLVLFAASWLDERTLGFSALLLASTLWALAAARKKDAPAVIAAAASDFLVLVALSVLRTESGTWELDSLMHWQSTAPLIGAAAVVRMSAGFWVRGPVATVVWWQGAALALVSGSSAAPLLVVAAVGWLMLATVIDRGSIVVATALVLLGASLGAGPAAIASVGLAGFAFYLGETRMTILVLAAAPLTPLSSNLPATLRSPAVVAVVVCLALLALCLRRLASHGPRTGGAFASTAAIALGVGSSPHPWWFLLAIAVGGAVFVLVRGVATESSVLGWTPEQHRLLPSPRWAPALAMGAWLLAGGLWLRLLLEALRSTFV